MAAITSLMECPSFRNARFSRNRLMANAPRADERGRRLLAAFAAGLALFLLPAAAAQAAVFVVTTTADGNNGACTVSLCTLRDAVIAANASPGSSITLPS